MSDNRTEETNKSRSFEERVFARFDAMDDRFRAIDERFDAVDKRFNAVDERFDAVDKRFNAVDERLNALDERLAGIDNRLDLIDGRVEKLESRQYDTKPIWEQALASIAETNQRLDETNRKLDGTNKRIDETNERMDRGFELLRNEMKTEFTAVRHEMEHSLRGVERKIDVLNQNILNLQVDQRYVDRRLQELESQIKPT